MKDQNKEEIELIIQILMKKYDDGDPWHSHHHEEVATKILDLESPKPHKSAEEWLIENTEYDKHDFDTFHITNVAKFMEQYASSFYIRDSSIKELGLKEIKELAFSARRTLANLRFRLIEEEPALSELLPYPFEGRPEDHQRYLLG